MKPIAVVLVVCLGVPLAHAADQDSKVAGEFTIPDVSPLEPAQLDQLRELIRSNDGAKLIADQTRQQAAPLLSIEPQPLAVIHYEGLVNTDPRRVATVEKLGQMRAAALLVRAWQASGDPQAALALKRLTVAWSETYRPTGNDVNENKLYPLLIAYAALRDDFSPEDQHRVDAWVERLGVLHLAAVQDSTHFTNRYSKHVRLLALAGLILGREAWLDESREGVKRFVRESLRADGTSRDLELRDSLGYHASALRPPLQLAMLSGAKGRDLYRWTSESGGSLNRSVEFLVPYAMGEKVHHEWVDTKVDLDRRRAAAGLEKYRTGKTYDPYDALKVMEAASFFDPQLMTVVRHLTDDSTKQFPTWTTLTHASVTMAASRPSTD